MKAQVKAQKSCDWLPMAAIVLCAVVSVLGCGEPAPVTGKVTGVVTSGGKPLAGVSVLFTPEGSGGKSGPASGAITDDEGRYALVYTLPNNDNLASPQVNDGAVVGKHVVTLADYKMMEEMLPPPGRVPPAYLETATSPLRFEVKEGKQTIDITILR